MHFLIHFYTWAHFQHETTSSKCIRITPSDSTAVFHRSLGMYKRVQSVGTLGPMLEPFGYKAQYEHGLRTASVNFQQDSFTSPEHWTGKLLSSSPTQNQRSAKCVRKSPTPGIWLYPRWSTDAGKNTGIRRDIDSRVHKLLEIKKVTQRDPVHLYTVQYFYLNVGLLQCFVVCHVSFGSYKTVHCIMCNMQDFVH